MTSEDRLRTLQEAVADRYRIEREAGHGGMATVYLAEDLKHRRQVAIKVLRPELASVMGSERFLREIRLTAGLHHPNILPLLDSGEAGGSLFYVMPYVPGGSLRDRLRREKQISIDASIQITCEIADALIAAHEAGIIHRDIKPGNVLLEAGHAVVADFGLARAIREASGEKFSTSGMALGTPGYMSPEQAAGEHLDGRSDMYSLACVLFEMLVGEPPYTGTSAQAIMAKQAALPVPSISVVRDTVPAGVETAIRRALSKVPADRFATVREFVTALQGGMQAGPVGRWQRPSRPTFWTGVALAFATVAVSGVWVVTRLGPGASTRASLDPTRIAVLYFEDLSPGKTLGHIANGLTEDLIDELSQVNALHLISPNGVRPFAGGATPVDSLARALGVGTVVGGSLASSGEQLRVTVRLIDAASGEQLQTQTIQQPWLEMFTLQDKLTADVTQFLRERLGREIRLREQRATTRSVRAWELVQQGEELERQGSASVRTGNGVAAVDQLWRADSIFRLAEEVDRDWIAPTIARGRVASSFAFVSEAPSTSPNGAWAPRPKLVKGRSVPWLGRAALYADQALRREPTAAEALALRGASRFQLAAYTSVPDPDRLFPLAEKDLKAAVRSRPDYARTWFWLAELYFRAGRFGEAIHAGQTAFEADAYLTEIRSVVSVLFNGSLQLEHFENARKWCQVGLQRYPGDPRFAECELVLLGWTGHGSGQVAEAWRVLRGIEQRDSLGVLSATKAFRRMWVAAALARSGMADSAQAVIEQARGEKARVTRSADILWVEAYVRLLLGQREAALGLLAEHLRGRPLERTAVATSPWYRDLRDSPEFRAIIQPPR